ncbi:D-alanyl-D-alanine carboxypeptidase [Pseudoflavonifractor sp. 60]|uniref:D-alanyl-D-alanine carboxypeptidase family protein n=1 Tax=Pseudoflavonifractor sp. 60 TaxID=2304576 RepID=UPI001368403B|nr:D-alanyl-D-alanine carboxypeptidase family protein [Pseudoflavonifractor sp. 60]NBI68474.1 D-alanyl-D-alanine carboxypeptidase [Pseudoflavonifractor sp. 60]
MKKHLSLLLAALLLAVQLPMASAAADSGLTLSCASCLLMEKETGTILLEDNAHEKLEPASVTKIMTLLLVMEAVDSGRVSLEDLVTVSPYAAGMGGSQVYLEPGEQMTVSEMIKCVTVVSGNDCAAALAEHLAGSEGAFVTQMNQRAQELGMTDTTFLNCTGLPAQGHVTSAHDIALMSRELILNHPKIREYTTIWMDTIRDGTFGLTNTNRLVRFYEGATGLKTGFTNSAQYCMSATAERNGMELIAVVMKAPTSNQRFEDAKALLDYGFANYAMTPVYPDAPLAPVDVLLGTQAQVQPQLERDCRLLVQRGEEDQVTTRLLIANDVEAPVELGQTLGRLEVYVGDELRDAIPILSSRQVDRLSVPGIFTRMLGKLLMAG